MTIMVKKNLVSPAKYHIKCPNYMEAEFITFHNTANDATAQAEINYMVGNNSSTSYHFAIDDKEVIQGIPTDRNAWACGDGSRGTGNRKSISIEVCYSKSGGERYRQAEALAIKFVAQLLHERNWSVDRVKEHHHWSGKNCPHCIRNEGRWGEVVSAIQKELNALKGGKEVVTTKPAPVTVKGYLNKGDKGVAVTNLQTLLEKAGYELGKIDGVFGQATEKAVRNLQKDNKLSVDGLAGQATMQVLEALTKPKPVVKPVTNPASTGATKQSVTPKPTSPAPVAPKKDELKYTRTLKVGMSGADVKELQKALNKLCFKVGSEDGKFGSKTKDGVKRYQSIYLANEVDGIAGKRTINSINKQLNK